MNPYLVHSSSPRPAQNNTRPPVVAQSLEVRPTLLAVGGDLADPDLVAHNLYLLLALHNSPAIETTIYYLLLKY